MILETWALQGIFVPVQLTSGSMAPGLLGPHFQVECDDCGYRFPCDAEPSPLRPEVGCLLCGWPHNRLPRDEALPGDRVLIGKAAYQWRNPRRWEVIAFRDPNHARRICVKRVVGLPGEVIELRDGDIYADGQIARKDLSQQRAMRLLVDDADLQPEETEHLPRRWRGVPGTTQWGFAGGRFAHPATPPGKQIDWLTYHHWQRRPNQPERADPSPVTDRYAYNATRTRRADQVHPACDLMVAFRLVKLVGKGTFVVRVTDGREEFRWQVDVRRGRYRVSRGDETVPSGVGALPDLQRPVLVEWSVFDDQLLLAFDGRVVLNHAYKPVQGRRQPSRTPLAIGVDGPGVEIRELKVFRDIYYGPAVGFAQRWAVEAPVSLASGEFFVLGDNNPASQDSRSWPQGPAVTSRLLVGKPVLVHFPAMRLQWGEWDIHVPDPTKIRYIR
jgi:signal peptidase I